MRVLVTGDNGYIGGMLTKLLRENGHEVTGVDTDYYVGCEFNEPDYPPVRHVRKDIRQLTGDDVKDADAIVHLAGLSNDPLGAFDPRLTDDINYLATVSLAKLAKQAGVRRFVYASSCSMYGIAGEEAVTEESPQVPVTEYAISKVRSEEALRTMAGDGFSPVYLRAATVYGVAPRLRCDLVVNNLTGWACTTGKIRIMSDGSPWRPTVHVEDLARAYLACLEAPVELVHDQAFNVGRNQENYQIRDMAEVVKSVVPGCEVEYTYEHGSDSRTYRVSFDKISTVLKDYFKPQWDIRKGVQQLYEAFRRHGLTLEEFTGNRYIRLNQLKRLVEQDRLDGELYWREPRGGH